MAHGFAITLCIYTIGDVSGGLLPLIFSGIEDLPAPQI
jgi:hypothetical protein